VDAVKTLMSRSLDYAGIFPPAQLPLNNAIDEFAACRQHLHSWFLARFVLPTSKVGEFAQLARSQLAESQATHQPWNLAGLFRSSASVSETFEILRSDCVLLRGLLDSHPGALTVDSCELPLPEEVLNTHDQELARSFFQEAFRIFSEQHFQIPVFFEVNLNKSFEHVVLAARQFNLVEPGRCCLKFRTGGSTPAAIVSPETLARAFRAVQNHRVPFKLTAGLHVATRHFDSAVGCELFGFLNVFTAAVIGWTHQLSETELKLLLEERSAEAIQFKLDGLSWKNYSVSISEIRQVRAAGLRSFGSCSFFEPIDELIQLKLIP